MRTYTRRPPEERFWEKVKKTDTCWVWTGSSRGGYGKLFLETGKPPIQAHWFLLKRHPNPGEVAAHECDNPSCVRPDHIFITTPAGNSADMKAKGRANWLEGAECAHSKITEAQAMLIKACPEGRGGLSRMAREFGVAQSTAAMIRKGTRWRHLPPPTDEDRRRAKEFVDSLP